MYDVKVYHSIDEVDQIQWDALAENNVSMCYAKQKTFEETCATPIDPRYVVVCDDGTIVGAAVCAFEKRGHTGFNADRILLGRLKEYVKGIGISFLPALACNPRHGYGTHCIFKIGLSQDETDAIMSGLLDAIECIAAEKKAAVYYSNSMQHETRLLAQLQKRGYLKTHSYPVSYIDLKWRSFDEYKKAVYVRFPSMKKRINREINKARKAGVTFRSITNVKGIEKRLHEVLSMNYRKYNASGSVTFKENYCASLLQHFGDDAIIYVAEKNDEIVGVMILLKHGTQATNPQVSVDYSLSKNDLTFFSLAYYEPVKDAIALGITRVYFGNALYETKVRRGCIVEETYLYYRPYKRYMRGLVKIWFLIHQHWMRRKQSAAYAIMERQKGMNA